MFTTKGSMQWEYTLLAAVIVALISSVLSLVLLLIVLKYFKLLSASVS